MLSNVYFLAKFRFDTAENEPAKNCKMLLLRSSGQYLESLRVEPELRVGGRRRGVEGEAVGDAPREPRGAVRELEVRARRRPPRNERSNFLEYG